MQKFIKNLLVFLFILSTIISTCNVSFQNVEAKSQNKENIIDNNYDSSDTSKDDDVVKKASSNSNESYDTTNANSKKDNIRNIKTVQKAQIKESTYGIVISSNSNVYNFNDKLEIKGTSSKLYQNIYLIKNTITVDGIKYFGLYNQSGFIGYIDASSIKVTSNPYIINSKTAEKYISIMSSKAVAYSNINDLAFSNIDLKLSTYINGGSFKHYNGNTYYKLLDKNENFVAYVSGEYVKLSNSEKGVAHHYNTPYYATPVKENWRIWQNIDPFKTVVCKTNSCLKKPYMIGDVFYHLNGDTYLQLIDKTGKVLGFVNRKACLVSQKGFKYKADNYISFNTKNAVIYDNLDTMHQKETSEKYYLKTVKSNGYYKFPDGKIYYSIYDNKDKWIGYIQDAYVSVSKNSYGKNRKYSSTHYATIKKDGYTIWGDMDPFEKERSSSDKILNKTYTIANVYYHFNGRKYLSLRDHNDKWVGYINANACVITDKAKGKATGQETYFKITKNNYKIWTNIDDFSNYKLMSDKVRMQAFKIEYVYYHSNGSKYYSLYDESGKWFGYINANGGKRLNYFSQKSPKYNTKKVPKANDYIKELGCGPTSVAMALCYFKNDINYTDPMKVATKLADYGLLTYDGLLINEKLFISSMNKLGLGAKYINSDNEINTALKKGHHVLLDGKGKNPFTSAGHFILACAISEDGKKVLILDPYNSDNNGWWTLSTLRSKGYKMFDAIEIWPR